MLADLVPSDCAFAFFQAQTSTGQQPAKIRVAGPVGDQKNNHQTVIEANLRADQKLQPKLPRLHMGPYHAVNPIPVCNRESRETEPAGFIDKLFGMTCSFEKGKIAFAPERNVGSHT